MKITRLDLIAYGPFTNKTMVFGAAPGGFALIYGRNETGKTSVRRAINAWLFGIPARTDDDFVHAYKKMRVSGELRNDAGDVLEFSRVKSRSGPLRNPANRDAVLANNVLEPYLRGIDEAAFMQQFSLGHAELRAGGKELQQLRGLSGESLFAAGLGVRGLSRVLKTLEEDAAAIYTKGSRSKSLIPAEIRSYKEATSERKTAECSPAHWQRVNDELSKAERQHKNVVRQRIERVEEQARLGRISRTLTEIGTRRRLTDELANCADVDRLPATYKTTQRPHAEETLRRVERQQEGLARRLDGLNAGRAALALPRKVLVQEQTITRLHKNLGAYEGYCADRPKREAKLKTHEATLAEIVGDLGLSSDPADWDGALCGSELAAELGELIAAWRLFDSGRRTLAKQVTEVDADLSEMSSGEANDVEQRSMAALEAATAAATRKVDLAEQSATGASELASAKVDLQVELAALLYWSGSADELERLPVPQSMVIDRMRRRSEELDRHADDLKERMEKCDRTRHELRTGYDRLCENGTPASQEMLSEARSRRQSGWDLVRRSWLDRSEDETSLSAFAGSETLPVAYEKSVHLADRVADELRLNADSAAQLKHHAAARLDNDERAVELKAERAALSESRAAFEADWRKVWSDVGIAEPGTPEDMHDWLDTFARVKAHAAEFRRASEACAARDVVITTLRGALLKELEAAREPSVEPGLSFGRLVEHCKQRLAAHAEVSRQFKADRQHSESLRKRRGVYASQQREQLRESKKWEASWSAATQRLGLAGTPTPVAVAARLARLDEFRRELTARAELSDRIEKMRVGQDVFETDVAALVDDVAPKLVGWPAADAVGELQASCGRAKAEQAKAEELDKQIARCVAERADGELEAQGAHRDLMQLCDLIGGVEPSELAEAEQRAQDKARLESKLTELDDRLLAYGGGATVNELLAETDGKNPDTIQAELEAVAQTISELDNERDELAGAMRDRQREVEAIAGGGGAADADERALACLGRIRSHADGYIRLRLAAAILRQRIEEHQGRHEDPVLAGASVLFQQFTAGAFSGLRLGVDDDGRDVIQGVRAGSDEPLDLEKFSDGTADQLYLALRLAYLEHTTDGAEQMPLIVDDILVDSDDIRTRATLQALGGAAKRRQILLLTHHERVRELARKVVPELTEVELE